MSTWCRDPCGDPSRQAPVDQESDSSSGLIWVRVEGLAARTRCRSEVTVTINSRRVWARRDGQGPRLPALVRAGRVITRGTPPRRRVAAQQARACRWDSCPGIEYTERAP